MPSDQIVVYRPGDRISFPISRDERDTILRALIELRDNDQRASDRLRRDRRFEQADAVIRHLNRVDTLIHNLKSTIRVAA